VARDTAAIDLPAGPSEVMVVADNAANPAFVAADLLSQAEHGPDSQVILVAFSSAFAARVAAEVQSQLALLPRGAIATEALKKSRSLIAAAPAEAVEIANAYAPEHLILQVKDPRALLPKITTSGSVFLGAWTPESLGDYASGTNHVLPTYGWARACSGLGLADFQRTMTVQAASERGLRKLGPIVERLALAENLTAHQRAVRVRLDQLSS
jgi:histidinol dehydrogenase